MTIFPYAIDANNFAIQNTAIEHPVKGEVTKKNTGIFSLDKLI